MNFDNTPKRWVDWDQMEVQLDPVRFDHWHREGSYERGGAESRERQIEAREVQKLQSLLSTPASGIGGSTPFMPTVAETMTQRYVSRPGEIVSTDRAQGEMPIIRARLDSQPLRELGKGEAYEYNRRAHIAQQARMMQGRSAAA